MLIIDGSVGEGGGQILRTSLALSLITGTPFRMTGIRAGRSKPGLLRQHLAAVNAAVAVGHADVAGNEPSSRELEFRPTALAAGDHTFAVGTAGSATLVLQTVLPALLHASGTSRLVLEGGTHNPFAPPYDFIAGAFVPLLRRIGADIEVDLTRPGFYPAGGGRITASITGGGRLAPLVLEERGTLLRTSAEALYAQVPANVAVREVDLFAGTMGWDRAACRPKRIDDSRGPGNALVATVASANVTEVFVGFGEKGLRVERVVEGVVTEVTRYLAANVPVFEHLADQLLLPLALGPGGVFRTVAPSLHFRTQVDVMKKFIDADVTVEDEGEDRARVTVRGVDVSTR